MKIEEWNAIQKDEATDTPAIEGDLCTEIDGIVFLVQRKNNFNNIICKRIKEPTQSLLKTFNTFRQWLEENHLQYIRIEGIGKHTYRILTFMQKYAPKTSGINYAKEESAEYKRHIWYVKTY